MCLEVFLVRPRSAAQRNPRLRLSFKDLQVATAFAYVHARAVITYGGNVFAASVLLRDQMLGSAWELPVELHCTGLSRTDRL